VRAIATAVLVASEHAALAGGPEVARCLAASEKAITLRKDHRLNEARAELAACARDVCPAEVRADCAQTLATVVATIPTIVLAPIGEDGSDLVEVRVTMDGKPFLDRCDGKAVPIDPGVHDFVLTKVDGKVAQKRVVIHEGERARRETVRFESPLTRLSAHASLGGVGVLGLILGSVAGGVASAEWADAKHDCGRACPAGSSGQNEHDTAVTWADVSTASFIGGGGLLAVGALLWLTAPRDAEPAIPPPTPPAASWSFRPIVGRGALGVGAGVSF
jgi:hypothetical protein